MPCAALDFECEFALDLDLDLDAVFDKVDAGLAFGFAAFSKPAVPQVSLTALLPKPIFRGAAAAAALDEEAAVCVVAAVAAWRLGVLSALAGLPPPRVRLKWPVPGGGAGLPREREY